MENLETLPSVIDGFPEQGDRPAVLALRKAESERQSYAELGDQVRRLARGRPDAEVDARLAEVHRQQLRVAIGEVQQANVAERRQLVEALRRGRLGRQHARRVERETRGRRIGQQLQKLSSMKTHFAPFAIQPAMLRASASGSDCAGIGIVPQIPSPPT